MLCHTCNLDRRGVGVGVLAMTVAQADAQQAVERASYYNTHAISASVGRVIVAMSWQEPSVFETVDTEIIKHTRACCGEGLAGCS
jgi:hypothetical protein